MTFSLDSDTNVSDAVMDSTLDPLGDAQRPQVHNPCNGFTPTPIRVVVTDRAG